MHLPELEVEALWTQPEELETGGQMAWQPVLTYTVLAVVLSFRTSWVDNSYLRSDMLRETCWRLRMN